MLQERSTLRPISLQVTPQARAASDQDRPLSALSLGYGSSSQTALQDVDMLDAGPSSAPLQHGNTTFFHGD